jgi:hypothetical protein
VFKVPVSINIKLTPLHVMYSYLYTRKFIIKLPALFIFVLINRKKLNSNIIKEGL